MWLSNFENAWLNFLEGNRGNWNAWETSRFGTVYKRRGVAAKGDQKRQRSERERGGERIRERAMEAGMCAVYKPVSVCGQSWLYYRHLESLACSSRNIATESCVNILGHFHRALLHCCEQHSGIFEDNWTPLASEIRDAYIIDIETSPCVNIWVVIKPVRTICTSLSLCILYIVIAIDWFVYCNTHILFIVQSLGSFQFLLWPCPGFLVLAASFISDFVTARQLSL